LNRYIVLKEGVYYQIDDGNRKFGTSGRYECVISRKGTDAWDIDYNFSFRKRLVSESRPGEKTYNAGAFHIVTVDGGSEGLLDDEITVTGSASDCVNKRGTVYSVDITEALVRVLKPGCSNIFTQGKMELKNSGSSFTVKADFGDGTCDNQVEVTLPGNVKKTITVK